VVVDGSTPAATVGETATGEVTTGTGGATTLWVLKMGEALGVGTGAIELIPRLLISVEPSGIPARVLVPDMVDDELGVEEAAILVEPDPHIPDIPDVSSTPEEVDIPELCSIPEVVDMPDVADGPVDMLGEPAALPVAGAEVPSASPPPS
jgi:hypothetical protein